MRAQNACKYQAMRDGENIVPRTCRECGLGPCKRGLQLPAPPEPQRQLGQGDYKFRLRCERCLSTQFTEIHLADYEASYMLTCSKCKQTATDMDEVHGG